MERKVKILLFGTGAVGSFYAGKLAQAGASVSVVARSDYNIVKNSGIKIKSVYGDFHFIPERVLKTGAEYNGVPDFIIVATKVLPEIDVCSLIKDAVKPGTSIVLLQNGIDIEKKISDVFPGNEVVSALAFVCVSRTDYGFVDHQDYGRIVFGTYPSGISDKVKVLENLFRLSGLPVESTEDVISARWRKLLWNAPFNPLSVICDGANTGDLIRHEGIRKLSVEIMREVQLLSSADGHPLDDSLIRKNIEDTEKMTPYKTSMLLDYENKRPLEVEAILGNALAIAEKYNINTPHLKTLYAILSLINAKNLA
jgi:2-dehydropantoate 2-reductase